jgi:hypothetical protein
MGKIDIGNDRFIVLELALMNGEQLNVKLKKKKKQRKTKKKQTIGRFIKI